MPERHWVILFRHVEAEASEIVAVRDTIRDALRLAGLEVPEVLTVTEAQFQLLVPRVPPVDGLPRPTELERPPSAKRARRRVQGLDKLRRNY